MTNKYPNCDKKAGDQDPLSNWMNPESQENSVWDISERAFILLLTLKFINIAWRC